MRLGTETGSLVNHIASHAKAPEPAVGMGATLLGWTDRQAGTIVAVEPGRFSMQLDCATRTDSNGMSECQDYEYTPNPFGAVYVFRRVARGKAAGQWREDGKAGGRGVRIGSRDHYHDFSF